MSATRDKSQKITFVYSNLYSLYRKGFDRAREGATQDAGAQVPSRAVEAANDLAGLRASAHAFESGVVIKAKDLKAPRATAYTPAELLGKRIDKPTAWVGQRPVAGAQDPLATLKQNLASLSDLQSRLRFMLKELEELIKT
jgi:hypothetical protein